MLIFGVLSAFYIVPIIYNDYHRLDRTRGDNEIEVEGEGEIRLVLRPSAELPSRLPLKDSFDRFAEDAIKSVKLKAWQQKRNATVKHSVC